MSVDDIWTMFPFPTYSASTGRFTDGSLTSTHPACVSCSNRECVRNDKAEPGEVCTCRFGVSYARIDDDRLVLGVVSSSGQSLSARARKRWKHEPDRRIKAAALEHAVITARELGAGITDDFNTLKQEALIALAHDPDMHAALAAELRKEFDNNLGQSHDLRQLVIIVQQYAESLLAEKLPGVDTVEAAEQLSVEGAIYFSAQLMLLKMDSLIYLQEINHAVGNERPFRIHPLVVKYARIYRWQAQQKSLTIKVEGDSHGTSIYNNQAINAVIQGILDNLVKYAPAGSRALVRFDESSDEVKLRFISLGPRIEPQERSLIFLPGYRAKAARAIESTGQGIGLAAAKRVSDALGLGLAVEQTEAEDPKYRGRYETTLSLKLQLEQSISRQHAY